MTMLKYRKYLKIQCESLDEINELIFALEQIITWEGDPRALIGPGTSNFYCYLTNPEVIYR